MELTSSSKLLKNQEYFVPFWKASFSAMQNLTNCTLLFCVVSFQPPAVLPHFLLIILIFFTDTNTKVENQLLLKTMINEVTKQEEELNLPLSEYSIQFNTVELNWIKQEEQLNLPLSEWVSFRTQG